MSRSSALTRDFFRRRNLLVEALEERRVLSTVGIYPNGALLADNSAPPTSPAAMTPSTTQPDSAQAPVSTNQPAGVGQEQPVTPEANPAPAAASDTPSSTNSDQSSGDTSAATDGTPQQDPSQTGQNGSGSSVDSQQAQQQDPSQTGQNGTDLSASDPGGNATSVDPQQGQQQDPSQPCQDGSYASASDPGGNPSNQDSGGTTAVSQQGQDLVVAGASSNAMSSSLSGQDSVGSVASDQQIAPVQEIGNTLPIQNPGLDLGQDSGGGGLSATAYPGADNSNQPAQTGSQPTQDNAQAVSWRSIYMVLPSHQLLNAMNGSEEYIPGLSTGTRGEQGEGMYNGNALRCAHDAGQGSSRAEMGTQPRLGSEPTIPEMSAAQVILRYEPAGDDTSTAVSEVSPQGSELLANFVSLDRAAVDAALSDFLNQLDNLGQGVASSMGGFGLTPVVLSTVLAATAFEVTRQNCRSARTRLGWAAGSDASTLTWFAGLPRSLSTEAR